MMSPRLVPRTLLLAALTLTAALAGCSLSAEPVDDGEMSRDNPTPSPMTVEQAQQQAYEKDPSTFCSPDDLDAASWLTTSVGDLGFAYLPIPSSTHDGIESDQILLAGTPLDSGTVPEDAVTHVSVRRITYVPDGDWKLRTCGARQELDSESVGDHTVTYLLDEVRYTKSWTLWELSGKGINARSEDPDTGGFLADIAVGDQTVTAMLPNEGMALPGRYSTSGMSRGDSDDPGRELVRYYEDRQAQK